MENIIKSTFGRKFNGWDILLLSLLIGYPVYIITQEGLKGLITEIASYIYAAIIIVWIVNVLLKKAKK